MNKKAKKNKTTILLIMIFIILLIIYFLIPKTRTINKTLSAEEYKRKIYDEVYKQLDIEDPEEKTEEDLEMEQIEKQFLKEDELYKVQN